MKKKNPQFKKKNKKIKEIMVTPILAKGWLKHPQGRNRGGQNQPQKAKGKGREREREREREMRV
jgi:hypothetical protein